MQPYVLEKDNKTYVNLTTQIKQIVINGQKFELPPSGLTLKTKGKGSRYLDMELIDLFCYNCKNPIIIVTWKAKRLYPNKKIQTAFTFNLHDFFDYRRIGKKTELA